MKISRLLAGSILTIILFGASDLTAKLSTDYLFFDGTGSAYDMSGSTTLMSSGDDDVWSSARTIGFDFELDGNEYSYFIASTNGPMVLGTSSSLSYSYIYAYNSFDDGNCPHPIVTAFFDDLVASGNGVRTKLFGSAPNRVRVLDWEAYLWYGTGTSTEYHFQVRIFEGSNKIEFWYGDMSSTETTGSNGQIGAAISTSNYISIRAGNSPAATGNIVENDLSNTPIDENTLYTLVPCQKQFEIEGDVSQGGTSAMDSADVLLSGYRSKVGTGLSLEPFTLSMGEYPCGEIEYEFTIVGGDGDDYTIMPESGIIGSFENVTPELVFTPSDTGLRTATLIIAGTNGFDRRYALRGTGFRCTDWVGNTSEGGTPNLLNGDTLLDEFQVPVGTSHTYYPIEVVQLQGKEGCNEPFDVSYSLDDTTGTYSIDPTMETVSVGGSAVPAITFDAVGGVGYQEAFLTVVADGESRTFMLRNFISAPGGVIRHDGTIVGRDVSFLRSQRTCLGETVISLKLEAENQGTGDFVVYDLAAYALDTIIEQGTPPWERRTDAFGNPVPLIDYFFTHGAGVAPRPDEGSFDSLVVPEGQTRTFYLNFVPQQPGRRYAELYFPTNAFNLRDVDTDGDTVQGLVMTRMFGRGLGAYLSDGPDAGRPEGIVAQPTKVRESTTVSGTLYNDGDCDLRIDSDLHFEWGDVEEFQVTNIAGGTMSGNDYILNPGQTLTVTARFTPSQPGTRRATMRLVTNDSTLILPEVTERGVYYWQFFGTGKHHLEARDLQLPPAVLNAENSSGLVPLVNTRLQNVKIDSVRTLGDTDEIGMDPNRPWPNFPLIVGPGDELSLAFVHNPDADSGVGVRTVTVLIFLANGDTTRATVNGYAGSRTIEVLPAMLFQGMPVGVGNVRRSYFTVTSTGTLPAVLQDMQISGPDSAVYSMVPLPRKVLDPGQTEFVEVSYAPQTPGEHSATIAILSNATNGPHGVQLNGEAASNVRNPQFDEGIAPGDDARQLGRGESLGIGAEGAVVDRIGFSPNPSSGVVTLRLHARSEGDITVRLYGPDGRVVRTIDVDGATAGWNEVKLDLTELPAGDYLVQPHPRIGSTSWDRIRIVR